MTFFFLNRPFTVMGPIMAAALAAAALAAPAQASPAAPATTAEADAAAEARGADLAQGHERIDAKLDRILDLLGEPMSNPDAG